MIIKVFVVRKQSKQLMSRVKNYKFVLKALNIEKIDALYKLSITSNIGCVANNPNPVTKITDIISFDKSETITVLDDVKNPSICVVTMINIANGTIYPKNTSMSCFWCRAPFKWTPLGCPINYVGCKINKRYKSNINGEVYELTENISNCGNVASTPEILVETLNNAYYETDGVFCSFNCLLAFIRDNKHNSIYKHSENLMYRMYFEIFGEHKKLLPAPHWRLLSEYGGTLSIDDFRESFNKVEYIQTTLHISPLGMIFEKKCLFN